MTNIARVGNGAPYLVAEVEQWVKWWREQYAQNPVPGDRAQAVDNMLDDLRDHIATGEALHRPCGPNVEDDEEDRWTPRLHPLWRLREDLMSEPTWGTLTVADDDPPEGGHLVVLLVGGTAATVGWVRAWSDVPDLLVAVGKRLHAAVEVHGVR
jgi:hypothetical protein